MISRWADSSSQMSRKLTWLWVWGQIMWPFEVSSIRWSGVMKRYSSGYTAKSAPKPNPRFCFPRRHRTAGLPLCLLLHPPPLWFLFHRSQWGKLTPYRPSRSAPRLPAPPMPNLLRRNGHGGKLWPLLHVENGPTEAPRSTRLKLSEYQLAD